MRAFKLFLAATVLVRVALPAFHACAQTNEQIYSLAPGSQLMDDCPFCDRLPIILPLTGTFKLRLLEQNPLFRRYELTNIAFRAGSNAPPFYAVSGTGVYQVGGEVANLQDLFLDVDVDVSGFNTVKALCVNSDRTVVPKWPELVVQADQTNGTPAQIFRFTLLAAPAPVIRSLVLNLGDASVRLGWDATGDQYQVERATNAAGPYSAISAVSTNSSFTDPGVLTNSPRLFYRLVRY